MKLELTYYNGHQATNEARMHEYATNLPLLFTVNDVNIVWPFQPNSFTGSSHDIIMSTCLNDSQREQVLHKDKLRSRELTEWYTKQERKL